MEIDAEAKSQVKPAEEIVKPKKEIVTPTTKELVPTETNVLPKPQPARISGDSRSTFSFDVLWISAAFVVLACFVYLIYRLCCKTVEKRTGDHPLEEGSTV